MGLCVLCYFSPKPLTHTLVHVLMLHATVCMDHTFIFSCANLITFQGLFTIGSRNNIVLCCSGTFKSLTMFNLTYIDF